MDLKVLACWQSLAFIYFWIVSLCIIFGGEARYIIETGFSSIGRMIQNFFELATYTDSTTNNIISRKIGLFFTGLIGWFGV